MTCIVGVTRGDRVWLGADRAASTGSVRFPVLESKIVEVSTGSGSIHLGYTTSFRFGQIAKYHTNPPHDVRSDPAEYLVVDFIPALRQALKDHGWTYTDNGREDTGTALVGYRGRLFTYQSDSSLTESQHGIDATGSGYEFALGAMSFAESIGRSAEKMILAGLEAAARFDPSVMGPFDVVEA